MRPVHLLLVDDERPFVDVVSRRMRARGFIVSAAATGEAALARLAADDGIEVVVLDVRMPGLGGVATLRAIKDRRPLVEVVMLTGHATVGTAVSCLKQGAFDYLMKPCAMDELVRKIEGAAERHRHHAARLFEARTKPYISRRERDQLIRRVIDAARRTGPPV